MNKVLKELGVASLALVIIIVPVLCYKLIGGVDTPIWAKVIAYAGNAFNAGIVCWIIDKASKNSKS